MSAVRRSNRLAEGSTPSSTILLTPKNSITRYGVKRRLKVGIDDTPTRLKAAKLLSMESVESATPQSPFETPKKKKQINFSPIKFDDSSDNDANRQSTPPRSLFPTTPPKSVGFSTPPRSTSRSLNFNITNGFETPKSARRKLFDQNETSEKCDLFVSTFSKPKPTQSGFGTHQRIAEEGKYARLISPVKNAANFKLPKKYQPLFDVFERMERIVAIKKGRNERCVFEELKKNVERDIKKNFTKDILAQVLTVYPTSYNVRLEDHRTFGMKTPGKKHDLVIEPNLKKDLESYWMPPSPQKSQYAEVQYGSPTKLTSVLNSPKKNLDFIPLSPRKSPTKATPQLRQLHLANYDRLEPWRMACRKAIFKYKLLLPVFELHDKFLNEIGASKDDLDNGEFHEKFKFHSIPDIIPSTLPEPIKESIIQTKLDPYLEKKKEFVIPANAETTLEQFKSPEKKTHTPNGKVPLSPTKFAHGGDTPKLSIYERLMLKQKANEARLEPLKVAKERRRNQLELIQQTLLYHVWSYFSRIKPQTTSKLDFVLHRLAQDIKLTGGELTEHVELLCECAHTFFIINTVGPHSTKYLRLLTHDDENDYRNIMEIIEKEFKKCQ